MIDPVQHIQGITSIQNITTATHKHIIPTHTISQTINGISHRQNIQKQHGQIKHTHVPHNISNIIISCKVIQIIIGKKQHKN